MMGGGLGTKWDRWEVVGRSFGKMENEVNGSRGGRKLKFSKMSGSVFPALGDQHNTFLAYSRTSEVQFGKPVRRFNSNRLSLRACMFMLSNLSSPKQLNGHCHGAKPSLNRNIHSPGGQPIRIEPPNRFSDIILVLNT